MGASADEVPQGGFCILQVSTESNTTQMMAKLMKSGNISHNPGRGFLLFAQAIILLFSSLSLNAESVPETKARYNRIYSKAVRDLLNGNVEEKLDGATKLGGHKVTQYIRPLGEELNRDLDHAAFRKTPANDPYVKSQIAWAIGRMGHRWSIPYLIQALKTTISVMDEKIKEAEKKQEFVKKEGIQALVLSPNREGPAIMRDDPQPDVANPDAFWSISDELKDDIAITPQTDDQDRLRLIGYNYVNLSVNIIRAIGEVGRQNGVYFRSISPTEESKKLMGDAIDSLTVALKHGVVSVRGAAALALGDYGTDASQSTLKQHFPSEEDFSVKVRVARAILENDKSQTQYYTFLLSSLPSPTMEVRRQAAIALRELKMGESVFALRDALEVEPNVAVREILKEAIYYAEVDNILPVNY